MLPAQGSNKRLRPTLGQQLSIMALYGRALAGAGVVLHYYCCNRQHWHQEQAETAKTTQERLMPCGLLPQRRGRQHTRRKLR